MHCNEYQDISFAKTVLCKTYRALPNQFSKCQWLEQAELALQVFSGDDNFFLDGFCEVPIRVLFRKKLEKVLLLDRLHFSILGRIEKEFVRAVPQISFSPESACVLEKIYRESFVKRVGEAEENHIGIFQAAVFFTARGCPCLSCSGSIWRAWGGSH